MDAGAATRVSMPDGRSIDAWAAGPAEGEALLFHCGTPGSGLPYGLLVDELSRRGMRWISFSRSGYGDSTRNVNRDVAAVVADSRAVLDSFGVERAWVLGWSGGGPHALACAALMPDRVRGTALIGGVAPYPAEGLDWLAGMGQENVEEFNAALAGPEALIAFKEKAWPALRQITAGEVADALGDLVDDVDRASIRGEFAEWMAAIMREGLRTSYWGWFDDDMAFTRPWGFDIGSIETRVHVWQGGHDRMVPYAHGEWLASNIGRACRHLLPGHGHLTLVVDSLTDILDELITD